MDKCENGDSRSPLGYSTNLCISNGAQCTSSRAWAVCGTPGVDGDTRPFGPVTEPSGGNPKAVSPSGPTAWSCEVCTTSDRYCTWHWSVAKDRHGGAPPGDMEATPTHCWPADALHI
ncbi:hypothetical protein CGRA01v4_02282 [Colletotrichum graminicola]|nr:hypothetical protein CGRA01v4_02282 [Colletotrichum graminicola]